MDKTEIPQLSQPWSTARRIVGDGEQYHNDFCLIRDKRDRWHCIGIGGQDGRDDTLFHAIGSDLTGPFEYLPKIASQRVPAAKHMWAPFAIWKDDTTAYLYYAHFVEPPMFTMRVLESHAPDLEVWTPYAGDALGGDNVVFTGPGCRDACIIHEPRLGVYIMYHVAGFLTRPGEKYREVIQARTSEDLLMWSEPRTVMTCPEGYRMPESPFVLQRNGLYYLWVCGHDYARMSLYVSADPFEFGHPDQDRVVEQWGHTPEIVTWEGVDYMACAGIASSPGGAPGEHDMKGVFLQELTWASRE